MFRYVFLGHGILQLDSACFLFLPRILTSLRFFTVLCQHENHGQGNLVLFETWFWMKICSNRPPAMTSGYCTTSSCKWMRRMRYKKSHVDNIVAARGPRAIGLQASAREITKKNLREIRSPVVFFVFLYFVLPLLAYSLYIKVSQG